MKYQVYPEYKYSGIEWHENIPIDWDIRRLKYFSESVSTGTTPSSSNPEYYESPSTTWYTPVDFVDGSIALGDSKRKINSSAIEDGVVKVFKSGSILVVGIGATLGKVALSKIVFTCNQQINVITPDKYMSPRFIAYSLSVKIDVMKMISNASTLGIMNQEKTKQVHLCAPSKDNQEKIADFLDFKTQQIDQLIEKKKALIEKLNEQRIAVITQAVTKGLDKNAKMKPSGVEWLGDVPEHWETRRLKFLTNETLQYGANEAAVLDDRDLPRFIRITDVKDDGTLHDDTFRSLPEDVAEPFLLDEGDILLARSGATVGKSFKYSKSWGNAAYAGYMIKFSVDKEIIDEEYAYLYFQSSVYWANINSTLIQSTIQNFSAEKYANIELPLPDREEQRKIVSYLSMGLNKIDKMKIMAQTVIEKLEEYRNTLITDAVTGKIDVRGFKIPGQELA